ncbi:MAG: sulfite exporter TauE/SafE family protein [Clostridium sp.]|nr:sulfite exporter TauE/SafE family protein [Clostridium sp.]
MPVLNYLLFFTVILLANIMQGITGFAGTILAMPFSLMLVGYPVAKPVLNVLGLLSGVYVFLEQKKQVQWKEVRTIVLIMAAGIFLGIYIKGLFAGREQFLIRALGVFVIVLGLQGLIGRIRGKKNPMRPDHPLLYLILPLAGIVHGIFVSGGPLLISYLTRKLPDKNSFRATISTVWIVLNSIVLIDDIRSGYWNPGLIGTLLIAVPFLLAAMKIGSILYHRMSQQVFMILTYLLLAVSGVTLLLK